jgi:hypothetical protein
LASKPFLPVDGAHFLDLKKMAMQSDKFFNQQEEGNCTLPSSKEKSESFGVERLRIE